MQITRLEVEVRGTDRVALREVLIHRENGGYLLAVRGQEECLYTSEIGAEAVRLFAEGLTIDDVRRRLQERLGTGSFTLAPLLEKLLTGGMIDRIGAREIEPPLKKSGALGIAIPGGLARRLSSKVAGAVYLSAIFAAFALSFVKGWALPSPMQLLGAFPYQVFAALALVMGLLNAAKHELAHVVAARALGVRATVSLGHRFVFPVLQTDLSGLWMVERRRRYAPFCAGMLSDALTLALIVIWMSLAAPGPPSLLPRLSVPVQAVLGVAFFVIAATIVWQFNIAVRTDMYYVVSNALGCRNLAADAKKYLLGLAAGLLGSSPGGFRPPLGVRVYSVVMLLGYSLTMVCFLAYLSSVYRALFGLPLTAPSPPLGLTGKIAMAGTLLLALSLVAYSRRRLTRRGRTVYRIRPLGAL